MPTNADRRRRARKALMAGDDHLIVAIEGRITDLITDLMHLADTTGQDAEATMALALLHYHDEVDLERAGI